MASDFDISEEKELKVFADRTEVLQLKLRILRRNVQKNSESLQGLKTTAERDVLHLQEELKALIENEDEVSVAINPHLHSRPVHPYQLDEVISIFGGVWFTVSLLYYF